MAPYPILFGSFPIMAISDTVLRVNILSWPFKYLYGIKKFPELSESFYDISYNIAT